MKFTPLLLLVCSASIDMPSRREGVRCISASVKSHCDWDVRRIGFEGDGVGGVWLFAEEGIDGIISRCWCIFLSEVG